MKKLITRPALALCTTLLGLLAPTAQAASTTQTFCNTDRLVINENGPASPYPSTIDVSGLPNYISDINVRLMGFSHSYPDDVYVLLLGPYGQNVMLMGNAGGYLPVSNLNLTFDDAAAAKIPDTSQLVTGDYQPAEYVAADMPAGSPPPKPRAGLSATARLRAHGFELPGGPMSSGATTLSTFNGTDPNATWYLYVYDDASGDFGALEQGWCLDFNASNSGNAPPRALPVTIAGTPAVGQALQGQYTYVDVEGDAQGASTFRWLRSAGSAATAAGQLSARSVATSAVIPGATGLSYVPGTEDIGQQLQFCVTPVAQSGALQGAEGCSNAVTILSAPAPGGGNTTAIPTLSRWNLLLLTALVAFAVPWVQRIRSRA